MENGTAERWGFRGNEVLSTASAITIRGVLNEVMGNINESDPRPVIPLGHGDPSAFPCFRTTQIGDDAIADALRSAKFNGYAPTVGVLPARRFSSRLCHLLLRRLLLHCQLLSARSPPSPPPLCHLAASAFFSPLALTSSSATSLWSGAWDSSDGEMK